jgi:hypothetical protein
VLMVGRVPWVCMQCRVHSACSTGAGKSRGCSHKGTHSQFEQMALPYMLLADVGLWMRLSGHTFYCTYRADLKIARAGSRTTAMISCEI